MNPLLPRMWILKLRPRIVDSQRVELFLSLTISNQIYKKMHKLYINKIQDYLTVCLFKKEIYSSDLRQELQKHYYS